MSELQAGGIIGNRLVHHHVALVVVVVLQVDGAVDLVELLFVVGHVANLAVRLSDQDRQEIIGSGNDLCDNCMIFISISNVDK